jgi:hypothetical protein
LAVAARGTLAGPTGIFLSGGGACVIQSLLDLHEYQCLVYALLQGVYDGLVWIQFPLRRYLLVWNATEEVVRNAKGPLDGLLR